MKLGSFCTGYGGLDMAVEAHFGATLTWYSEVSKDCNQLLAHYWPEAPNLGDLTAIDWDQVEPVDIMCAGFPCQPFSHAGKREGANDERAIFSYIADGISVLRPGIVVLENVAGLLTLGGPGVVGTLTGMGYDLRWGLVRASDAGAPHRRARWFCIATHPAVVHGEHGGQAVEDSGCVQEQPRGGDSSTPDSSGERHGGRQDSRGVGHLDRRDESQTRQQQRPRPEPVDRGSAAPTDSEGAERRTEEHETVDSAIGSATEPGECDRQAAPDPDGEGLQGCRGEHELREDSQEVHPPWGDYDSAIRRWEATLGRPAPAPADARGLSPLFVEWMMGLPEGHVCDLGMSRTAELKMLGNGVVPPQAALALEILDG